MKSMVEQERERRLDQGEQYESRRRGRLVWTGHSNRRQEKLTTSRTKSGEGQQAPKHHDINLAEPYLFLLVHACSERTGTRVPFVGALWFLSRVESQRPSECCSLCRRHLLPQPRPPKPQLLANRTIECQSQSHKTRGFTKRLQ